MPIRFFEEEVKFKLPKPALVKKWVELVCKKEGFKIGDITYIFCNDSYLLKLNITFLNHSTFTDIITFDYSEGKTVSGDIFISIDRVAENSKKFLTTKENELLRVMVHGVLHLIGYSDKKKSKKIEMRKKENEYLSLWGK